MRRDAALHLYEIGDLDPFFWPYTKWYGLRQGSGELGALALLYEAPDLPVLLALGRDDDDGALASLVQQLHARLPRHFYAHLSAGIDTALRSRWALTPHGRHLKMTLTEPAKLAPVPTDDVQRFGVSDLHDLHALYERAYPGNWFDARMVQTGHYYGIRQSGRIVCVAGIHVYSARYRVAALGNVTTDPELRGRGLARRATAKLCRELSKSVETIGLNVLADNAAAIACYRCLGFTVSAEYDEMTATALP